MQRITFFAGTCAWALSITFFVLTFFISIAIGLSFVGDPTGNYASSCSKGITPAQNHSCELIIGLSGDPAGDPLICIYTTKLCEEILARGCPYEIYGECPEIPLSSPTRRTLGIVILLAGSIGSLGGALACVIRGRCCDEVDRRKYEEF